jgi:septal ring factor EnvC (AmiA/AmiB activator)
VSRWAQLSSSIAWIAGIEAKVEATTHEHEKRISEIEESVRELQESVRELEAMQLSASKVVFAVLLMNAAIMTL